MHVANLELCKALYEVSRWDKTFFYYNKKELLTKHQLQTTRGYIAAYDLGYLLRKLPAVDQHNDHWEMWRSLDGPLWHINYAIDFGAEAIFPEDAACKLAIELFKSGVLKKESN